MMHGAEHRDWICRHGQDNQGSEELVDYWEIQSVRSLTYRNNKGLDAPYKWQGWEEKTFGGVFDN